MGVVVFSFLLVLLTIFHILSIILALAAIFVFYFVIFVAIAGCAESFLFHSLISIKFFLFLLIYCLPSLNVLSLCYAFY